MASSTTIPIAIANEERVIMLIVSPAKYVYKPAISDIGIVMATINVARQRPIKIRQLILQKTTHKVTFRKDYQ